jgi:hypothetical protein
MSVWINLALPFFCSALFIGTVSNQVCLSYKTPSYDTREDWANYRHYRTAQAMFLHQLWEPQGPHSTHHLHGTLQNELCSLRISTHLSVDVSKTETEPLTGKLVDQKGRGGLKMGDVCLLPSTEWHNLVTSFLTLASGRNEVSWLFSLTFFFLVVKMGRWGWAQALHLLHRCPTTWVKKSLTPSSFLL